MCGIFGYLGNDRGLPSERNAAAALATLSHRGPDAQGTVRLPEHGLVLGHARLSIIDPAARSDQPFTHGECTLVFNGEIYNYQRLRAELQQLGSQFRTSSDTEVILEGYRRWGADIFSRLRGMYAIALFDARGQQLLLARDEFGIKPLCYLQDSAGIVFGSEVKAIAALRSLSVDGGVLSDLLSWGFQMENSSLYSGVRYLEPGTLLRVTMQDGRLARTDHKKVWSIRDAYAAPRSEPSNKALHEVIEQSVADHMIADVPVAVALSGGLDSSIVTALAAKLNPDLQAFTFTLSPDVDAEVEHAALVCRHLNIKHMVARMRPIEMRGWLRQVAWHLEEPAVNVNSLLGYGLGSVVRTHGFKVVLVGEGADEVFGGYPWYQFALEPSAKADLGSVFDAYWRRRAQTGSARFLRPAAAQMREERVRQQRAAFAATVAGNPLDAFLSFDQATQLQYSQLLRVDRMYMAHGVEARVPFLYRSVLEASAGLPSHRKLQPDPAAGRTEKIALAEAFKGLLPQQVLNRPKFGSGGTVNLWDSWLSQGLEAEFDRCLLGAELRGARQLLDEFIDWKAVEAAPLAPKEKFSLSLLLEAVDSLMLSRSIPDSAPALEWEVL
jgi:asparagine synthase (glutamine-hydrolysing)